MLWGCWGQDSHRGWHPSWCERRAGTLKGFPHGGRHVAERREGSAKRGGKWATRTSRSHAKWSRGSVGAVRVAVGSHLLLLSPLGSSVLEPDLGRGNN